MIGYNVVKNNTGGYPAPSNITTNSNGEFRIEGLSPNPYSAYVFNPGQSGAYADPVNFEIISGDVAGLEIKMIRGGSISGVAVVEGVRDPSVLAQLASVQIV
jgi:hypothetical protein